jgi:hypothetical protein
MQTKPNVISVETAAKETAAKDPKGSNSMQRNARSISATLRASKTGIPRVGEGGLSRVAFCQKDVTLSSARLCLRG